MGVTHWNQADDVRQKVDDVLAGLGYTEHGEAGVGRFHGLRPDKSYVLAFDPPRTPPPEGAFALYELPFRLTLDFRTERSLDVYRQSADSVIQTIKALAAPGNTPDVDGGGVAGLEYVSWREVASDPTTTRYLVEFLALCRALRSRETYPDDLVLFAPMRTLIGEPQSLGNPWRTEEVVGGLDLEVHSEPTVPDGYGFHTARNLYLLLQGRAEAFLSFWCLPRAASGSGRICGSVKGDWQIEHDGEDLTVQLNTSTGAKSATLEGAFEDGVVSWIFIQYDSGILTLYRRALESGSSLKTVSGADDGGTLAFAYVSMADSEMIWLEEADGSQGALFGVWGLRWGRGKPVFEPWPQAAAGTVGDLPGTTSHYFLETDVDEGNVGDLDLGSGTELLDGKGLFSSMTSAEFAAAWLVESEFSFVEGEGLTAALTSGEEAIASLLSDVSLPAGDYTLVTETEGPDQGMGGEYGPLHSLRSTVGTLVFVNPSPPGAMVVKGFTVAEGGSEVHDLYLLAVGDLEATVSSLKLYDEKAETEYHAAPIGGWFPPVCGGLRSSFEDTGGFLASTDASDFLVSSGEFALPRQFTLLMWGGDFSSAGDAARPLLAVVGRRAQVALGAWRRTITADEPDELEDYDYVVSLSFRISDGYRGLLQLMGSHLYNSGDDADREWLHLAAAVDLNEKQALLYLNGRLMTDTGYAANDADLEEVVGRLVVLGDPGTESFQKPEGRGLQIFERLLTPQEIRTYANRERPSGTATLT